MGNAETKISHQAEPRPLSHVWITFASRSPYERTGCPGEATIGIRGADELPALMRLSLYVSLSRLALGIKTIEVLFEPMLGGFAGIDGAAQHPPLRGHRSAPASQSTWAH